METMKKDRKISGVLFTVCSSLGYGLAPAFCNLAYRLGANAVTMVFFRYLFSIPVSLLLMWILRAPFRVTWKQIRDLLICGVAFRATTTLLIYLAYDRIGSGLATTFHFLYPVITALICVVFFREKMGVIRWVALAMAFVGVLLQGLGDNGGGEWFGIVLASLSALCYSVYMLMVEKTSIAQMHPMAATAYMNIVIAGSMTLFDFLLPNQNIDYAPSATILFYALLCGVLASLIGTICLQIGIVRLGASTAAMFSTLEPVFCVIFGVLILGENPGWIGAASCLLIVGAACLALIKPSDSKVAR